MMVAVFKIDSRPFLVYLLVYVPDIHTAEQRKQHEQPHVKWTKINCKNSDHQNRRTVVFLTF
jgi:hypothetical protein